MSAQLTWKALDEVGDARTEANRPAFLPQTLAFSGQTFFWPRNLPQERYNSMKPVPKKEIPIQVPPVAGARVLRGLGLPVLSMHRRKQSMSVKEKVRSASPARNESTACWVDDGGR